MENNDQTIESLFEKAEEYGKTRVDLLKYKYIDNISDIVSALLNSLLSRAILLVFSVTLSMGIALWLGDILGKNYYGFLILSGFYAILGIILSVFSSRIKTYFKNKVIHQLFN